MRCCFASRMNRGCTCLIYNPLMRDYVRSMGKSTWAELAAISFVLSFCCVFGISYVAGEGWAAIPFAAEAALTVGGTAVFAGALLVLGALLDRAAACPDASAVPEKLLPLPVLGLIMCVAWSPWLIANFPGSSFFDTYFQIYQFYPHQALIPQIQYTDVAEDTLVPAWLVDHHPWFSSIIYGAVAQASDQLTGTWMAGFFAFSTVQALLYVALFIWVMRELRRWGVRRGIRIAFFALICLVPAFPVWASCVMKDSLFGLFFFAWFLMLLRCVLSKGADLGDAKGIIAMFLLALMMCLTKKTGVYIVVVTAIVGCIAYRRDRRIASALSAFALQGAGCALIMFAIVPLLVFPALNIAPGGKQEALGSIFQQTARYAQDHELTEEEERIIDEIIPIEVIKEHYDPVSQDDVKYYFNTHAYDENLTRYLELWASQGLRDPEAYFASIMSIAGFYVAPTITMNLRMVTVDTDFYGRHVLWNPEELAPMREGMAEGYEAIAAVPVLDIPLLTVVYALWVPALVLFVGLKRRAGWGLLFVPLAVVLAFCIIGPVYDARYAWGLILASPVLLCLAARPVRQEGEERDVRAGSPSLHPAKGPSVPLAR